MQKVAKTSSSGLHIKIKRNKSPNTSSYDTSKKRKNMVVSRAVCKKLGTASVHCFLQKREQTQATTNKLEEFATAHTKETMETSGDAAPIASQSVPKALRINWTTFLQQPPNYSESRFPVPLSLFQRLTNCQKVVQRILEDFKRETSVNFLGDDEITKRVLINYYIQFYESPKIRELYRITVKPCPICIKHKLLSVPQTEAVKLAMADVNINKKTGSPSMQLDFSVPVDKSGTVLPDATEKGARNIATATQRKTKFLHKSQICDEFILQYIARNIKNPKNVQVVFDSVKADLLLRKKDRRHQWHQRQQISSQRRPSKPQILSVKTIVPANPQTAYTFNATMIQSCTESAKSSKESTHIHASASSYKKTIDANVAAPLAETSSKQLGKARSSIGNVLNNLKEAASLYFNDASKQCTLPYLLRFHRETNREIIAAIMTMSCNEFKRYTQIYEAPTAFEDEHLLKRCYEFTLHEPQVWPINLYITVVDLHRFLKSRRIVFAVLSLEDISPKLLHWQDLVICTNFDDCVRLDYYRKTGENMPETLLEERRICYYNKCWLYDKWLRIVPTINEATRTEINKALSEDLLDNEMPVEMVINKSQKIETDKSTTEQPPEVIISKKIGIAALSNKRQSSGKIDSLYESTGDQFARVVPPLKLYCKPNVGNAKAIGKNMDVAILSKVSELPAPIVETKPDPIQLESQLLRQTQLDHEKKVEVQQEKDQETQKSPKIQRQQEHELNNHQQSYIELTKSKEQAQLKKVCAQEQSQRQGPKGNQMQESILPNCSTVKNHQVVQHQSTTDISVSTLTKLPINSQSQEMQQEQPTTTKTSVLIIEKSQEVPGITKARELSTDKIFDRRCLMSSEPEYLSTVTKISILPTDAKVKSSQVAQVQSVMSRITERFLSKGLSTSAVHMLNECIIKKEKEFVPLRNLQFDLTAENSAVNCEEVDLDTVTIEDSQTQQDSIFELLSPTETSCPKLFPLQIVENSSEENLVARMPIQETQPLELATSLPQEKDLTSNKRNELNVVKSQVSQAVKRKCRKAVNTDVVPQLTHEFRPLPIVTSKRTNVPVSIELNLRVTPSPPVATVTDETPQAQVAISQNSQSTSTPSQTVIQALSGDTTLFNNTRILQIINEELIAQLSQQNEINKQQANQSLPNIPTNTIQSVIAERFALDANDNALPQHNP